MIRKFSPASSKATPLRLSYMDRAVNEAKLLRTKVTSSGNEWPAFTAKIKWSKKGRKGKLGIRVNILQLQIDNRTRILPNM
jgi:hypothetical protein